MPKISAVLIVKNESECLAKCLDSIKGVDEIIICDTGSEDNTVEIAKRYTDKVFTDFVWCDDFAKARNHALSKATGDYVLSIDADEYLQDFSKLKKAVEEAHLKGSFVIDCKLIAENDGQSHKYPRLFKRCPEVWWEGAVHNHLSRMPDQSSEVEITYGYSPAHLKDPDRAFRILKKEVDRAQNPREMFYLGREYWYRRMYQECLQVMGQYVLKSKFLAEKADAFLIMSRCYFAMGLGDDARDACVQAIICNPHFKEACLFMSKLAGKGSGNPTWENNGLWWEKSAENCDNTNVLFVRI